MENYQGNNKGHISIPQILKCCLDSESEKNVHKFSKGGGAGVSKWTKLGKFQYLYINIAYKQSKSTSKIFRKDIKLALTSMVMVSIFVLCHSVIWIPRFYEHVNGEEANICKMRKHVLIGYFFTTIYSSIKCCAYFLTRYRLTSNLRSFVRNFLDCYYN